MLVRAGAVPWLGACQATTAHHMHSDASRKPCLPLQTRHWTQAVAGQQVTAGAGGGADIDCQCSMFSITRVVALP
eukprot:365210-Chlamydomonas_euryale.AAC.6